MKKLYMLLLLPLAALLCGCESDMESESELSAFETRIQELISGSDGKIDMDAFVADVQRGVWIIDDYELTYTNGKKADGYPTGGSTVANMKFFSDGTCREYHHGFHVPNLPTEYVEYSWSVSPSKKNTFELYYPRIDEMNEEKKFDDYASRTTLTLLYYKDGVFVMKGLQPYARNSGRVNDGFCYDYCMICGHIAFDQETIDRYLSYGKAGETE